MQSAVLETSLAFTQSNCKEIDLSADIGYPLKVVVNGLQHEQPLFWQSWSSGELVGESTFLQPAGLALKMLFTQEDFASIPAQALVIADSVTSKKFQMLQAMLISPASMELALSNPLLFVLLVNKAEQDGIDSDSFTALVLEKRSKILDYLALPSSKSVLRLLARTQYSNANGNDLDAVLEVLSRPVQLARLRHVKQLSLNHILFLQQFQGLFWPGVLELITPETNSAFAAYVCRMASDCCALGANLDNLRTVSTNEELNALHNRLINVRNQARNLGYVRQSLEEYGEFPSPPLAGNTIIVPLTSWKELTEEGQEMHHCISVHGYKIAARNYFVYKVLTQQRLTLAITPHGEGWRIDEVRGHSNTMPTEDSLQHIHDWFKAVTEKKKPAQ